MVAVGGGCHGSDSDSLRIKKLLLENLLQNWALIPNAILAVKSKRGAEIYVLVRMWSYVSWVSSLAEDLHLTADLLI